MPPSIELQVVSSSTLTLHGLRRSIRLADENEHLRTNSGICYQRRAGLIAMQPVAVGGVLADAGAR